jgi:bacillolysin
VNKPARLVSVLSTAVLAVATLSVATSGGAQGAPVDSQGAAVDRLRDDASSSVKIVRSDAGDVTFVGTPPGKRVDNPAVDASTSVREAAESHLARYGAALGTARKGTSLREHRVLTTAVGNTVRYQQEVGGLPVLGGDVVVSLGKDRELTSLLSTMSTATRVPAATVSEAKAATAASTVARGAGDATVTSAGRWLLDPAVINMSSRHGARGVWRFTVAAGVDVNKEVFVDDQTGAPLLAFDNNHQANRIVCDLNNVPQNPNAADPPCTAPVRSEGGAATGITDVDNVYTFVGATSDLFQSIGVDLTDMIGKDVSGTKKISSTVRLCYTGTCPYANAFWNGTEMYYGTGLTVDDVTGHELTHGVTDRTSELLYWGQSGAINESISDIIGEIVDHRTATSGDSPTDWRLAEDSSIGSIRDLADPNLEGDPDRTQDPLYVDDLGSGSFYDDNGGVHSNSGVSNKTAYLIMEGGTFNGQTVTGIDGGDTFPKTARLYQLVNESLSSGADFADLGNVLVQACNTLVGSNGFTSADCTEVQEATQATQLHLTPANAPQPADASTACPAGSTRTVLFDSETGTPATKFTGSAEWTYGEDPAWGSNAHSGQDSWSNVKDFDVDDSPQTPRTESMATASAIAIPATGSTYLSFHGWYFLDFYINGTTGAVTARWDAATVEVDDVGDPAGPVDVAAQPWVNGPSTTLSAGAVNPAVGRQVYSADSAGWVGSRLDLAAFAGKSVKPQFSVNYDNSNNYIGWFVDDITVYNCAPPPVLSVVAGTVNVKGKLLVGKKLKAKVAGWSPGDVTYTYQWLRNGKAIKKAKGKKYKLTKKDKGKKLQVVVTASKPGYTSATVTSKKTKKIKEE